MLLGQRRVSNTRVSFCNSFFILIVVTWLNSSSSSTSSPVSFVSSELSQSQKQPWQSGRGVGLSVQVKGCLGARGRGQNQTAVGLQRLHGLLTANAGGGQPGRPQPSSPESSEQPRGGQEGSTHLHALHLFMPCQFQFNLKV